MSIKLRSVCKPSLDQPAPIPHPYSFNSFERWVARYMEIDFHTFTKLQSILPILAWLRSVRRRPTYFFSCILSQCKQTYRRGRMNPVLLFIVTSWHDWTIMQCVCKVYFSTRLYSDTEEKGVKKKRKYENIRQLPTCRQRVCGACNISRLAVTKIQDTHP